MKKTNGRTRDDEKNSSIVTEQYRPISPTAQKKKKYIYMCMENSSYKTLKTIVYKYGRRTTFNRVYYYRYCLIETIRIRFGFYGETIAPPFLDMFYGRNNPFPLCPANIVITDYT